MNRANRFARALLCALLLVAAPLVQAADPPSMRLPRRWRGRMCCVASSLRKSR